MIGDTHFTRLKYHKEVVDKYNLNYKTVTNEVRVRELHKKIRENVGQSNSQKSSSSVSSFPRKLPLNGPRGNQVYQKAKDTILK